MTKFSITLMFLLIFITSALFSQFNSEWKRVDQQILPLNFYYENLKCSDSMHCMLHISYNGGLGFIFRGTSDGGLTWKNQYTDTTNYFLNYIRIRDIAYPDSNLFIAVGDSGTVIRTTDKGKTWERKQLFNEESRIGHISMLDSKYGVITSLNYKYNSIIEYYFTIDGGYSWNKMTDSFPDFTNGGFKIIDENTFVALSEKIDSNKKIGPPILLWVKGKWDSIYTYSRSQYVSDFDFVDNNKGWFVGGQSNGKGVFSQIIHYTSDAGESWIVQRDTNHNRYLVHDIDMFNEKDGMAGTGCGVILITHNGGKTWHVTEAEDIIDNCIAPFNMRSIQFTSITTAYVIGGGDYIYKYTRDWSNPIDTEEQENEGYNVSLYPNPAADKLNISLTKDMYGEAEVSLINIHGRTISSFKTREFICSIDISALPPGVYGVIARFGNKVISKRVSKIR